MIGQSRSATTIDTDMVDCFLSALYNLMNVRALFLRERAGSYYS